MGKPSNERQWSGAVSALYAEGGALRAEAGRIASIKRASATPVECGFEIPDAPGRGPVRVFQPHAFYPKGERDWERKPAGYLGRSGMQRADAFDVMTVQARRKHGETPFTSSQVDAGREYRNLVEKMAAAGVRCSSLEGRVQHSSSGNTDWIDAVVRDGRRLDAMRSRIGHEVALRVQRARPSAPKASVTDRQLVDLVCVADCSLSEVLTAFGWSRSSKNIESLRASLCGALDRLQGY